MSSKREADCNLSKSTFFSQHTRIGYEVHNVDVDFCAFPTSDSLRKVAGFYRHVCIQLQLLIDRKSVV